MGGMDPKLEQRGPHVSEEPKRNGNCCAMCTEPDLKGIWNNDILNTVHEPLGYQGDYIERHNE